MGVVDLYTNSIKVMKIDPVTGMFQRIDSRKILSPALKMNGFCLYNDLDNNILYGFISTDDGAVEQWRLFQDQKGDIHGEPLRYLNPDGKSVACVADDEYGYVYIADSKFGIVKFPAQPDKPLEGTFITDYTNEDIVSPVSGLTIYQAADKEGYIIASSKGNSSFAIFDRKGDNEYLGSFTISDRIENGDVVIDAVENSSGIDVINHGLGNRFPKGVFVAQDSHNLNMEGDSVNQNYKFVAWEKIANLFDPPLLVDSTYSIRNR
jgi:3-phytase